MAKTQLTKTNQKTKIKDERTSLKGTLASVFLLGLFLILSWLGVYFLFLDRL
ncbi:cytochrome c oxidase subunit 2A [Bacillus timonensis]|uniref:cytochrome c oxidase subunit 2A n=1 Tax=Bacillus timonensis TaxID=1033734 RepID=UPI0002891BDC|nr:cytochrome c oxidase subunit 2A [Bacillus timonensis]